MTSQVNTPYPHTPPPPPVPPLALPPLPYHRLALATGRHRWWRPLAGTAVVLVGAGLATLAALACGEIVGALLDRPQGADGFRKLGPVGDTAVMLGALALVLPVVLLAARWVQRRPAGTVSSVTGRVRWGWLGRCLATALPFSAVSLGIMMLLPEPAEGEAELVWAGTAPFLTGLVTVCLLVPFQAAAEEYMFRGWLLQAVGAWFRSPWIAVLPQALLFGAAHGWGTPWGFADLCVFGVVAGWLTIRTGGLEAAIALHVLNNLLAFGLMAGVKDGLASEETAADMGWTAFVVDVPMVCLYAGAVLWIVRRRGPATHKGAKG
ncbi:CPBP family intramembrane metalloprotease [Streptomyces sp. TRM66268-LWL]|uniref:CPBP family intramembrane metalloprotease n=1 Tax=Streptomyces polyasparticus TaxID=2767826 RepID=A0ABR7SJE3_9ACTN|nr:CPBP family intramembrane glutamic endopeptidase [Streptomyces polyasparticus]MBC9715112.1 CPBP family intramembrane metalloprotease [Streptomyces polyasparticus]